MLVRRPNHHYKDPVTLLSVYISGMVVVTDLIFQVDSGKKGNQPFEPLERGEKWSSPLGTIPGSLANKAD